MNKTIIKPALEFGAFCGGLLIFVAEAIAELEGKTFEEGLWYSGIAFFIGFLGGFLLYYLYSRNKHQSPGSVG